jgi:enoyl-CoA hydratase
MTLHIQTTDRVTTIAIARPHRRNAVDVPTAQALFDAFAAFDADAGADVAILTGEGGHFCAGADLQASSAPSAKTARWHPWGPRACCSASR